MNKKISYYYKLKDKNEQKINKAIKTKQKKYLRIKMKNKNNLKSIQL